MYELIDRLVERDGGASKVAAAMRAPPTFQSTLYRYCKKGGQPRQSTIDRIVKHYPGLPAAAFVDERLVAPLAEQLLGHKQPEQQGREEQVTDQLTDDSWPLGSDITPEQFEKLDAELRDAGRRAYVKAVMTAMIGRSAPAQGHSRKPRRA